MLTFVFCAGNIDTRSVVTHRTLEAVGARAKSVTPSLGQELDCRVHLLPEANCGWCQILPSSAPEFPLVSEASDDQFAVIAFGDTVDRQEACAQSILAAWKKTRQNSALDVEGCYCAVIVDRVFKSFVLLGDAIGQRALHYYMSEQWLVASPHDVCLAATGIVPIDYDLVTAGSIASVEWSLGGRSLLKDVKTVSPRRWVHVQGWECKTIPNSIVDPADRIERNDSRALASNRDRVIETLRSDIGRFVGDATDIKTELSAGIDSRAVLVLLLSVVAPERVIGITYGDPEDLDVRVAKDLAARLGIRFRHQRPPPIAPEEFDAYCDLLAFCCNGDATSLVAATNTTPIYRRNPPLTFAGNGGEIYRGYYYPFRWRHSGRSPSREQVLALLQDKCRFSRVPWASDEMLDGVRQRMAATVDELFQVSPNGYDVLDLFYLYERFGVWAARSRRCFWNPLRWSPFSSRAAARLAFRQPAPIGDASLVHRSAIQRFAANTYRMPINNEDFLHLMGGGALLRGMGKTLQLYHKLNRRYGPRIKRGARKSPIDKLRSDYFDRFINQSQSFSLDEGVSVQLLGKENLKRLLRQQRSGGQDHAALLGSLLTMERWRTMVNEAAHVKAPITEFVGEVV